MARLRNRSTGRRGSAGAAALVARDAIERRILLIRDRRVMLDSELASLYGVATRVLNQAVRRNIERFPDDFMFELSAAEDADLKSQGVISSSGHGGRRYRAHAFTEQGVAMLSSVLRSPRAVAVNIEIMRAFVRLREIMASHSELARKIDDLDRKFTARTDEGAAHIDAIYALIEELLTPPATKRRKIGFHEL